MDATTACFHTDMDELIHAHPPRETEPDCVVVWLLFKAHSGARKAARLWLEYVRNEVVMSAGWNAAALEPNAYHKTEDLNDDDDTCTYGHSDRYSSCCSEVYDLVELVASLWGRTSTFQKFE